MLASRSSIVSIMTNNVWGLWLSYRSREKWCVDACSFLGSTRRLRTDHDQGENRGERRRHANLRTDRWSCQHFLSAASLLAYCPPHQSSSARCFFLTRSLLLVIHSLRSLSLHISPLSTISKLRTLAPAKLPLTYRHTNNSQTNLLGSQMSQRSTRSKNSTSSAANAGERPFEPDNTEMQSQVQHEERCWNTAADTRRWTAPRHQPRLRH